MFPYPGPVSVRSGPVQGNSGFRVAPQVFNLNWAHQLNEMVCSVASPICQEGQSERTFPNFPLFLIFPLFFPLFPDFLPFSWFLAIFSLSRGALCLPLDPPVAMPLKMVCRIEIKCCYISRQITQGCQKKKKQQPEMVTVAEYHSDDDIYTSMHSS